MQMGAIQIVPLLIFAIFSIVIVILQIFLSLRKVIIPGCLLPALFLLISVYFWYRSSYVRVPHSNMANAFYQTGGMIGFLINTVILIVCRVVLLVRKNQAARKK